MIKRYSPSMELDPRGDYVEIDAYLDLEDELEDARQEIRSLNEERQQLLDKIDELYHQIERLAKQS